MLPALFESAETVYLNSFEELNKQFIFRAINSFEELNKQFIFRATSGI